MDKLQIIKQESSSNLLQTEPMSAPPDAPKQGKCSWILERGDEKGDICNKTTFDGEPYCNAHLISNARREAKRLKKERGSDSETREINVQIKASGGEPQVEIKEISKQPTIVESSPAQVPIIDIIEKKVEPPAVMHIVPKIIPKESFSQNDILAIINNFSIAIVNLTEILKK